MTYEEKKAEMKEKYAKQIELLALVHDVDVSEGWDYLKMNAQIPNHHSYVNQEELEKDYAEMVGLAEPKLH